MTLMGKSVWLYSGFLAAGMLMPLASAQAVEAQPDSARTADTAAEADDRAIIVTARRREERLQDVPVAVTALSGEDILRANIDRTDELQRVTPGYSVTTGPFGNSMLAPTIRSQRQPLQQVTFDQSVNTYFAEVVQARPVGLNTAFYDIASVQILKGPQGTLFGRNSPGGAMLITPQAPTSELEGYLRGTVGDYDLMAIEGAVNLPISEAIQLRGAGRFARRDGYDRSLVTGNELDNERSESGRLSLRIAPPNSRFSTIAVLDYVHQQDAGGTWRTTDIDPQGLAATFFPAVLDEFALVESVGPRATTAGTPRRSNHIHSLGLSVISELELSDNLKIKNIFGYRRLRTSSQFDLEGTSLPIVDGRIDLRMKQYSDELQLLGEALDGNLDFILGGYIFEEKGHEDQETFVFFVPQTNANDVTHKSKSIFAQATYRVPGVNGLSLTLGGRQTWDERFIGATSQRLGVCRIRTGDAADAPLADPCFFEDSVDFKKFTYTASVEYKPIDDVLVYLAHRTGYRTGGFAAQGKSPSEFVPFRPEKVSNFELGIKADWTLGGTWGRTNIAAYTDSYKDIQRSYSFFNGANFTSVIDNAGNARIKGIEIEQIWRPVPEIEFNLAYALSDANYKTFILRDGRDFSNSPFSGAPKHTLSGSIRVELPISDSIGDIAVQASGYYRSKTIAYDVISYDIATDTLIPELVIPSYHTFNARIDWDRLFGSENLSAAFWVKNLTDEVYVTTLSLDWQQLGIQGGMLGAPRTFGFDLRFDF